MKSESDEGRKANPYGMCKGPEGKEKGIEMENTLLSPEISKASQNLEIAQSQSLQQTYYEQSWTHYFFFFFYKYITVRQFATGLHI